MGKSDIPNNLMGELLGGRKAGVPERQQAVTPEQQKARTPVRKKTSAPEHHNTSLKKATFYLPGDILADLESAWLTRRAEGDKTSKSQMVAEAMRKYLRRQK